MQMRVLLAIPESKSLQLVRSLLDAALALIPLNVTISAVHSREELMQRLQLDSDDVIFLDWPLAEEDTPALVRSILRQNPRLRIVALLPMQLRQYRQTVWQVGACNSIPKEHMDQEWLSSLLCVMWRAMEREARALAAASNGGVHG